MNEREGGTLFNTLLFFGPDGTLLARHRKLMPTGGERLVWGAGDGSRLQQRLVHREGIVIDLNAGCGLFGPLEARDPDTFSITAIHSPEIVT